MSDVILGSDPRESRIREALRIHEEVNTAIRSVFSPPPPRPLIEVLREFESWLTQHARPYILPDDFDRIMRELYELETQIEAASAVTSLISRSLSAKDLSKSYSGIAAMTQHSFDE